MDTVVFKKVTRIWKTFSVCFLAFFWTFSFSVGFILGSKLSPLFSSLMLSASKSTMSIVGWLMIHVLPLIISVIAIHFKASFLIIPIAIIKGFFFGYILSLVFLSFGYGGWLVCALLLFSDSVSIILLLWAWSKLLRFRSLSVRDYLIYFIALTASLAMDMLNFSPLLSCLMDYC